MRGIKVFDVPRLDPEIGGGCGGARYGRVVGVEVPKLSFRHRLRVIIGVFQQGFHEDDFVNVVGCVKCFPADFTVNCLISEKDPLTGAPFPRCSQC